MQDNYKEDVTNFIDDEISLRELFDVLFKGKWIIIGLTTLASIIGVTYSLLLPNIYQSNALLAPVDSSNNISGSLQSYGGLASLAGISIPSGNAETNATKAIKKINTLSFFEENVLPGIFLPDLMAVKSWDHTSNTLIYDVNIYDKKLNKWVRDYSYPSKQIPSAQESFKVFQSNLNISEDKKTGFVIVSVKHKSPYVAQKWTELLINEVNDFYRQKDKSESLKAVNYLNNQIKMTNLSEIKKVIAELLQNETQKLTLIEANKYYVFDYIDPPAVMEQKSEPNRAIICILSALIGVIISFLIVFIRHYGPSDKTS